MPKHLELQEEAEIDSWKVPVSGYSPAKHPWVQTPAWEMGPLSLPSALLFSQWWSWELILEWWSEAGDRWAPQGHINQNQSAWGRICYRVWALFSWDLTRGPGLLCIAPSRKWELLWTLGHGLFFPPPLPSALTSALFLQWFAEPELHSYKLGLDSL